MQRNCYFLRHSKLSVFLSGKTIISIELNYEIICSHPALLYKGFDVANIKTRKKKG